MAHPVHELHDGVAPPGARRLQAFGFEGDQARTRVRAEPRGPGAAQRLSGRDRPRAHAGAETARRSSPPPKGPDADRSPRAAAAGPTGRDAEARKCRWRDSNPHGGLTPTDFESITRWLPAPAGRGRLGLAWGPALGSGVGEVGLSRVWTGVGPERRGAGSLPRGAAGCRGGGHRREPGCGAAPRGGCCLFPCRVHRRGAFQRGGGACRRRVGSDRAQAGWGGTRLAEAVGSDEGLVRVAGGSWTRRAPVTPGDARRDARRGRPRLTGRMTPAPFVV